MRSYLVVATLAALVPAALTPPSQEPATESRHGMRLGNFSVSLSVADLAASRSFYEKLGFETIGGDASQNWLILRNGSATIGLFQGMFERNTLTFNPGWDAEQRRLDDFEDVRQLQRELEARGVEIQSRADEKATGPASLVVIDPDGNPILIDQHVE